MKRIWTLILTAAASVSVWAAQPLLSPQELNARLKQPSVRVIDIRDAKAYADKRIPGAVNAPYAVWRGPASNPGELPELNKVTALVQSLGLTPETHAVVVSSGSDATDFGAAARVYWTLKALGLKELSIVNGGVSAWSKAGLPLSNAPVQVAPSSFKPQWDKTMIASKEELVRQTAAGGTTLVDARPAEFFEGETRHVAAKVPGTLKGAAKLSGDKDVVSFCNTGHWAATNWFALSEVLGQKHVRLYPGSMVEWTQDARALPMDNVPSRVQQLAIDAKLWAERKLN